MKGTVASITIGLALVAGCAGSKSINGKWQTDLPETETARMTNTLDFKDDGTYLIEFKFFGKKTGNQTFSTEEGTWAQSGDTIRLTPTAFRLVTIKGGVTKEGKATLHDSYEWTLKWQGDDELDSYFDEETRNLTGDVKQHLRRVKN